MYEISSKGIGTSKLASHLKLLSSSFKLKDDDAIVMSAIIKKSQDMSRNRSFLIIEVGKIVRFLLLLQGTNAENGSINFALKRVKRPIMENTQLHVYNNILHNINLVKNVRELS